MQIVIRKAENHEAAILADLNTTVQQIHVDAEPQRYKVPQAQDPALIAFYTQILSDENTHTFIAEIEGKAVGYIVCLLRQKEANPFTFASGQIFIDQISVKSEHQGKGLGQALMQEAEKLAQDLGINQISLSVRAFNTKAIAFYEQAGFEVNTLTLGKKLSSS